MAAAGWYNDESDRELARWHDGVGWTEHVVVKAEWEALGYAPPPPAEPGHGRLRAVVGSAAVVALLVVGGVALAQDDGDDPPAREQTGGAEDASGGLGLAWDEVVSEVADAADGSPLTSIDLSDVPDLDTNSSVARSAAPRSTAGTSPPVTVRRTETSTRSQTNPGPRTEVGGGDKTSVGNTSATTIQAGYEPPPPTTTTPTTAPPPPVEEPTTTTAAPSEPVGTP